MERSLLLTGALLAVAASGCGRLGFDRYEDEPGADGATTSPVTIALDGPILRGTVELAVTEAEVTVELPRPLDRTRAILRFGVRGDGLRPAEMQVSGAIVGDSQVTFRRSEVGGPLIVSYQIASFAYGVRVQHGSTNVSGPDLTEQIGAVDPSRTVVLSTYHQGGDLFDSGDFVRVSLEDPTTLQFSGITVANLDPNVEYQVIEFEGARVHHGRSQIAADQAALQVTTPAYDAARSWVVYSYSTSDGLSSIGDKLVTARLDDGGVALARAAPGSELDVSWAVVELPPGVIAEHGTLEFAPGVATGTVGIFSEPGSDTLFTTGALGRDGVANQMSATSPGDGWVTGDVDGGGALLQRAQVAAAASFDWTALSFAIVD